MYFLSSVQTRRIALALFFPLFCLGQVIATAAVIDRIEFVMPPEETISETYLLAQIKMEAGISFAPDLLSEDIRRLYGTGIVTDIEAEVLPADDPDRVYVRFLITPSPLISEIEVIGNQEISDARILRNFPLEPGERLDTRRLTEGLREIRSIYERRGFREARIEINEVKLENGRIKLQIEIDEQARHKIRSVDFSGNQTYSDRQLRRAILSRPNVWAYLFNTGFLNMAELGADRERLRELYEDQGYLDFEITEIEKTYSRNDKWVSLTFHIEEGHPYTVESIDITGNDKFSDQQLFARVSMEEGEIYSLSKQRQDVVSIRGLYHEHGFLDHVCRPRLHRDGVRHTVGIVYQIHEGEPARIRDIIIIGNTVTQDRVLRREVALEPGELADARKIENTRARLHNLRYFEQVQVTPLPTEEESWKDLEIAVKETMTGRWGVGGGVSSDTGLFGFFEVEDINFDISKLFRFQDWPPKGAGQRASFRANIGTEINEFILSFVEPWMFGYRLRMQTDLYMRTYDQYEYDEERIGGFAGITRSVSLGPDREGRLPWWRGNWRQAIGFRLDQVRLTGFSPDLSPELRAEEGNYIVSALSFGMSRDTRDSFIMPTRGATLGLSAELQSEAIGAYSNIYKLELRGSRYFPLARYRGLTNLPIVGSSVFKLSGEAATVDRISGSDPAIFDRYFAGGQYSLRGFDTRQVSPADINEDPVGGRSRMLGATELMYPVHDTVWVSIFSDFGNVWRSSWDWNPGDMNVSAGIGLQLDLQAIPIRFDYGIPIVTRQEHLDTGGILHFSLGRSF